MDNSALAADVSDHRDRARPLGAEEFVVQYERWRQPIYRYMRSRSGSDEEAADLAATAFERAWAARRTFRGPSEAFSGWLFGVARRLSIDAARRRISARRGLVFWPAPVPVSDPADLVLRDEADGVLVQRVAGLAELQREVLLLRYAGGLTAREIGAVIGKTEEATQKLISRALGRLKETYRDDE